MQKIIKENISIKQKVELAYNRKGVACGKNYNIAGIYI
jgi:hypothetical protein